MTGSFDPVFRAIRKFDQSSGAGRMHSLKSRLVPLNSWIFLQAKTKPKKILAFGDICACGEA
jgi:hypothetical protein